jgi:hypothetical protein
MNLIRTLRIEVAIVFLTEIDIQYAYHRYKRLRCGRVGSDGLSFEQSFLFYSSAERVTSPSSLAERDNFTRSLEQSSVK